jgi:hypothetical protein
MSRAPIHADPLAAALARKAASGARGQIADLPIASGDGWRVQDIICTCGPHDHEAEELTSASSIALVLSGSFVVRDRHGTSLLSEGSYLLVNAGHCFACSHRHGEATVVSRSASNRDCSSALRMTRGAERALRTTACRLCARLRRSRRAPGSR